MESVWLQQLETKPHQITTRILNWIPVNLWSCTHILQVNTYKLLIFTQFIQIPVTESHTDACIREWTHTCTLNETNSHSFQHLVLIQTEHKVEIEPRIMSWLFKDPFLTLMRTWCYNVIHVVSALTQSSSEDKNYLGFSVNHSKINRRNLMQQHKGAAETWYVLQTEEEMQIAKYTGTWSDTFLECLCVLLL